MNIQQPTSEQHRQIICLQQNGATRKEAFKKIMGFDASELATKEAEDAAKIADHEAKVAKGEADAKQADADAKKELATEAKKKTPAKKTPAKKTPAKKTGNSEDWD